MAYALGILGILVTVTGVAKGLWGSSSLPKHLHIWWTQVRQMPPASPAPLTSPLLMGDASQCHNRWSTNSRISWNRGFFLGQKWHIVSRSWPGPSQRMFAESPTPSSPPSARRHKTTPSLTRSGKKYFELNPRWKQHSSIDKKFYIRIFPFFYASQYFLANSFFSLFSTFPIWLDA